MAFSNELDMEGLKHSGDGDLEQRNVTQSANDSTSDNITPSIDSDDDKPKNSSSKLEVQHSAEATAENVDTDDAQVVAKDNEFDQDLEKTEATSTDKEVFLYCKRNQQSHGSLISFKMTMCPLCSANLEPPTPATDVTDQAEEVDQADTIHPPEQEARIKHTMVIKDRTGEFVSSDPYDGDACNPLKRSADESFDRRLVLETIASVCGNFSSRDFSYYGTSGGKSLLENSRYSYIYRGTDLKIHSKYIIDAINVVAPFLHQIGEFVPHTLAEPYAVVGYHLQALKDYAATANIEDVSMSTTKGPRCSKTAADHLNILLDWFANSGHETKIREEEQRHGKGLCTFRMLWLALRPGMTVYMVSDGIVRAYVIESITASTSGYAGTECAVLNSEITDTMKYTIKLWNLRYDNKFVGRQFTDVIIAHFEGEKPLRSLTVIPIDFYDEEIPGTMKARLEECGRFWYKSLCGKQVAYKGTSMQTPNKQLQGRAYIDPARYELEKEPVAWGSRHANYYDYNSRFGIEKEDIRCACETCQSMRSHPSSDYPWKDYDVIDPKKVPSLDLPDGPIDKYHRYLLCDRTVWALMLKTRKWELLDIAGCKEPMFETNALNSLVMSDDRKKMIKALVMKFRGSKPSSDGSVSWKADFVEGKGEGTIFLLHGGPGIGKTFTAECIAEYTEKPLISLTCADIGTDELKVEERLSRWLDNAERWGAVLLIDEADIFLEKRRFSDLKRNSLVSVFLRCLEYYRGILFLTTNRVGTFDDAFISRIHVVIKYDALEESDRRTIWKQFFDKLQQERENFRIHPDAREYVLGDGQTSLCKQRWNGREIRNAFQTAIALADYRATDQKKDAVLQFEDLDQVCRMTKDFKSYIDNVHGGKTEDERAQILRQRAEEGA